MAGLAAIDLADQLALADSLADAAGAVIRRYFRSKIAVDDKADASPVTIADREAEAAMRRLIEARVPAHGILGEEYGEARIGADWVWVLDPIDGTKSFISGVPLFGTLIALLHQGVPVLGVIDQPISGERWRGSAGAPTTLNGAPIRTRPCGDIATASLFATAPDMFAGSDAVAFRRLQSRVKLSRFGSDCYAYGLVAAGFIDCVVEACLKPYDYCAMGPIIEGAGGKTSDWQGKPLGLASDGRVVCAGDPALHETILTVLDS
ncbi:MAG: histidinol-phosphatase [Rhodospirillales bacterium]|nr:histidinol-phosphatase [Rhodospirillales bacterium]